MILYPRSDQNSDDDRLALLADPDLAKRLRKANPKFFTRAGHHSIAKALALAGIVSLVAGYFLEPMVVPPYRSHDHQAAVTTLVQRVAPVPAHAVRTHHTVAPPIHVKPVAAAVPKAVTVQPVPLPQLQPQKQVQRRAHTVALTQTQTQPQSQAQNEEKFWLKAQAEARAKDQMRAKAQAETAAAESAAEDTAVQAPPKAPPPDTGPTQKIIINQPPMGRVPPPVAEPWPTLPGGGSCTPGRGPILTGGRGLTGVLINAVLQSAIPVHHRP